MMELNKVSFWIPVTVLVFILLDEAVYVAGGYCPYKIGNGQEKIRHCAGKCCSDTYRSVCCEFNYPSGAYVGAGVGTIIVLGVIILCTLYICCKQRLIASYRRANESRNQRTGTSRARGDNIPSVSGSVDPILPPPYETLPPPYYNNEVEMGENSGETKEKEKSYPDYPPPEYTEYSETDR